jgi:hypothetical protein
MAYTPPPPPPRSISGLNAACVCVCKYTVGSGLTVEDIRPEYLTRHIRASKNFCFSKRHTTEPAAHQGDSTAIEFYARLNVFKSWERNGRI